VQASAPHPLRGTHGVHCCQEAVEVWPGDVRVLVRAGPDCFPGSSSQLPDHAAVWEVSSWSARSRVAARTNELGADERRRIIGSEEGSLLCWWWGGRWCFPARGWAEWSHKHPFGVSPGVLAGAMTMCPGTGLLSHEIERGLVAGSCRRGERARGLVTPSRSVSVSWRLRGPCWRRCRRVMCLQPGRWRVGGRRG